MAVHGGGMAAVLVGGVLTVAVSVAGADDVVLRGGGTVRGVVVEKSAEAVVIETSPGRITVPMSAVERIVTGPSPLATWRERSAGLSPRDVRAWSSLAVWAEQNDLHTQARKAWEQVLHQDPENAQANAALGRVRHGGVWMSAEAAYRAQGLVPFEGEWVSPAERDAVLKERAASMAASFARREAQVRLREAEARAREAEARAASSEAMASTAGAGSALWFGGGGFLPFAEDPNDVLLASSLLAAQDPLVAQELLDDPSLRVRPRSFPRVARGPTLAFTISPLLQPNQLLFQEPFFGVGKRPLLTPFLVRPEVPASLVPQRSLGPVSLVPPRRRLVLPVGPPS